MQDRLFVKELKKEEDKEIIEKEIEKILLKSTNDLEWLKENDKVLLKPALNSNDPYPATTSPLAIKVVKRVLEEKGAVVIVADQSGLEYVVSDNEGTKKGDTSKNYIDSGMGKKEDNFIALEKRGWNSYKKVNLSSWPNGMYISNIIDEVDHIIGLPRVSTHVQAGVTLGFKNMVGLLREDSRLEFHNEGPLYSAMKNAVKGSKLNTKYINKHNFIRKMTEITKVIENKLRLTLYVADKAQVTIGPDSKHAIFKSKQIYTDPGYIFASDNIIATEIFATDILINEYNKLKLKDKLTQKFALMISKNKDINKLSGKNSPFVKHALKLKIGNMNYKVNYEK